jgi:hypothetical protein
MGLDDEIAAVQAEKKRREAELLARGAEDDDLLGAADKYGGFETSIAVDEDDQGVDEREQGLAAYAPPPSPLSIPPAHLPRMWTAGVGFRGGAARGSIAAHGDIHSVIPRLRCGVRALRVPSNGNPDHLPSIGRCRREDGRNAACGIRG